MLIVVEDRDVEGRLQALLDLEALRGGDVLEVDPAEHGGQADHGLDDLVGVAHVEADREAVDAGELLEQERLALHHRQGRLRADVAEAEHGRAVGDDGDRVLLDGQVVHARRVGGDDVAHPGHTRRVGHGQVVPVAHLGEG